MKAPTRFHRWGRRRRRDRELALLLWAAWDPIGSGVPPDEYDDYVADIRRVLRAGGDAEAVAAELDRIRRGWIELGPNRHADLAAAEKIVDWNETAWGERD